MCYHDRIKYLTDRVHELLLKEGATISETRDVFKTLQGRANMLKMPPRELSPPRDKTLFDMAANDGPIAGK
jgi:hypothetical protein